MLNVERLLDEIVSENFWSSLGLLVFQGPVYNPLFLRYFFKTLYKKGLLPYEYKRIFIEKGKNNHFDQSIQHSFLGKSFLYWCGDLTHVFSQKNFNIQHYKGPHVLSCFVDKASRVRESSSLKIVTLPHYVSHAVCKKLYMFCFDGTRSEKFSLIDDLFSRSATISLDGAFLLMQILEIVSIRDRKNFTRYMEYMLDQGGTLFELATHFFAKDTKKFFILWKKLKDDYSPMFWIAFFSEQLWRAYFVKECKEKNDFSQVKSLSFRLPHHFIRSQWRSFSYQELSRAYSFVYMLDYRFKTGSSYWYLDLFFCKFFFNEFVELRSDCGTV